MNKTQKRSFVKALCRDVVTAIMDKVDHMPEEWDGIELRQYIADEFGHGAVMTNPYDKKHYVKRLRSYRRAKAVL